MPARRTPQSEPIPPNPAYRIEALTKGLRLLSLFDEQRSTWRIADMASALDIPMPTVFRIVMTLMSEGYLEALPDGQYRPGVRVLTLGSSALHSLDLIEIARPRLEALADATGETVNLATLTGDRVVYLIRIRNADLVTANIQVGSSLPAAHSSIGKLLLAFLDAKDVRERITKDSFRQPHGPNAHVTLRDLQPDLAEIRERGWSLQNEEVAYGLRSVAAPIRDRSGSVVAGANVAVSAQDWPVTRIVEQLLPRLRDTCAQISGVVAPETR